MSSALTRAYRVLADCLGSSTLGRNAAAATKAVPPSSRNSSKSKFSQIAFFEPLEDRTLMSSVYYVSPSGNDSNNGTSSSTPWKSIGKISATHLNAGDQVLFQGGQTFYGSMNLYNDGGSGTDPVVIGSYGSGRATLNSGSSNGIWALDTTGLTIENLKLVGTVGNTGSQDGIRLENYTGNSVRSGYTVTGCDISGYAQAGIVFGYDNSSEGLSNVSITNNSIYNNVMTGIESYSVGSENNKNVYIGNNLVHDNYGDGTSSVTGSGIMLQGLNGATVERNTVYNNGAKGGNGGVGVWCYSSNAVVFQYNQSYDNHTTRGNDGDGFDFDADTSNSIMQYNFAANNDGGGFQLNQWWNDNTETGNIIRYNISQNNGRKDNYSGIEVWGKVLNSKIYNNTVYVTPATSGTTSAFRISNNTITTLHPSGLDVVGNIFITTGGTRLVDAESSALSGASGIVLAGNVYYASGSTTNFNYGTNYTSLAAWQSATGQEMLNGKSVGLCTNPDVQSAGNASPQATAATLSSITAYDLLAGSPVLSSSYTATASLVEGTYGVTKDFLGNAIASTSSLIAGVVQSSSTAKATTTTTTTTTTTSGTGTISGTVKLGSTAISGETVYLDANNNSVEDSSELHTTTSSTGSYSFSNVPIGSYIIRQAVQAGDKQTSPATNYGIHVTISSGTSLTSENFVDAALTKLTGTTIGTTGGFDNGTNTRSKALDGSLTTYFDGPTANGVWVGLDLGSSKTISQISFAPRSGYDSRMVGGEFQVSNSVTFSSGVTTVYTITSTPTDGSLTTITLSNAATGRYVRYLAPNGSYGDVAEVQFFG